MVLCLESRQAGLGTPACDNAQNGCSCATPRCCCSRAPETCLQVEWQWRQLPCDSSSNSSPARRDMSALLQLQDGRLVLFGGRSEQGKALQDTWAYHVDR